MILRLEGDVHVVMEATGIYNLPALEYLKSKNIFVAVINPFEMKEYACRGLRRIKTINRILLLLLITELITGFD